jgi:HSP20 family protein
VNVEDNVLTIAYEKKRESSNEDKKENYLRREFSYNAFKRSFALPDNADIESIKASGEHGVLNISVPKEEVKATKAKEIKVG